MAQFLSSVNPAVEPFWVIFLLGGGWVAEDNLFQPHYSRTKSMT